MCGEEERSQDAEEEVEGSYKREDTKEVVQVELKGQTERRKEGRDANEDKKERRRKKIKKLKNVDIGIRFMWTENEKKNARKK